VPARATRTSGPAASGGPEDRIHGKSLAIVVLSAVAFPYPSGSGVPPPPPGGTVGSPQVFTRLGLVAPVAACLGLLAASARAEPVHEAVSIGPRPAWTRPVAPPGGEPSGEPSSGLRCLVKELQAHAEREEYYFHDVVEIVSETGLSSLNEIGFEVDPSFQHLTIHRVGIHRDGRYLDRLKAEDIEILRQEADRDRRTYNGRLTALIILHDLRVGDRIEWSSSIRGDNPAMAGHFGLQLALRLPHSIEHHRIRVVHAKERKVRRQITRAGFEPEVRERNGLVELRWDLERQAAEVLEDLQPLGYVPMPVVRLTDFEDWGAVVEWALPLYEMPPIGKADLRRRIEVWKDLPRPEDRVSAALRFVQDEIRYLAFAIGPSCLRPSPPDQVFTRRFGDCKDKSLLLCSILRECGIEARPALVNTTYRSSIEDCLPSVGTFDHTIVHVPLRSGSYWLDATATHQRGDLEMRSALPYGRALVIAPGERELRRIPPQWDRSRVRVTEAFALAHYDSAATLDVETVYDGVEADGMRQTLADFRTELARDYLNFYARMYPDVVLLAPLDVEDDIVANRITVREEYSIPGFWAPDPDSTYFRCKVTAHSLVDFLDRPERRIRSTPLAVPHPFHLEHVIEIRMPEGEDWNLEEDRNAIEDAAFHFEWFDDFRGNHVRCTYRLDSKDDAVPPERVPEYLANLEQVEQSLTYTLYRPIEDDLLPPAAGTNWALALGGALWGLLSVAAAVAFATYSSRRWPPAAPVDADPALVGIRGWLILIAIGVVLSPLSFAGTILVDSEAYSAETWAALTTPSGSAYHPMWAPALLFELFGNLSLLVLSCLLVWLFFRKRRTFPAFYILLVLAHGSFLVLVEVVCLAIPGLDAFNGESVGEITRAAIGAAIWIPYMRMSKRVKSTFVW
jgi:hypothetical protein